jgi:hypothetical protein
MLDEQQSPARLDGFDARLRLNVTEAVEDGGTSKATVPASERELPRTFALHQLERK